MNDESPKRVRLDKWLWAARFYKTRSQSAAAIKGGKIDIDGARAKPSQKIGSGSRVEVRKGPIAFSIQVRDVAERRGSAEVAQALYVEEPDSIRRREEIRARLAAERAAQSRGWANRKGRPTKKQRRELEAFQARLLSPEDFPDPDDLLEYLDDDDDAS